MSDLRELYQQIILDHSRNPHNFRRLPDANHSAQGYNPLCGDKITVDVRVEDGRITAATFDGSGCAISQAAASLMTSAVTGKTTDEAEALLNDFHSMVTGTADGRLSSTKLGKLAAFAGVREYPSRVKCATLCWHTLRAALEDKDGAVTTE
jgi:nitrogen fixation NifU-like protein